MMGERFGETGFRRHTCFAGDPASTPFCPMLLFFGAGVHRHNMGRALPTEGRAIEKTVPWRFRVLKTLESHGAVFRFKGQNIVN